MATSSEIALIVGVGPGLSASLARLCHREGMQVALAARSPDKLGPLCEETGARAYPCDASDPSAVDALFSDVVADLGSPNLVVYNPSGRVRGSIVELDRQAVRDTPKNIHVGHFIIDGGIGPPGGAAGEGASDMLDPDAIAQTYLHTHHQHRSAWTWEIELRPWVETF